MRDDFDAIVRDLTAGTPTSLSRWGDGEWHCILGHPGQNCDGQVYKAGLRTALSGVLLDRPRYRLALQAYARLHMGEAICAWLAERQLAPDWIDADLFAHRSLAGVLGPFLTALQPRQIVLVGPAYLGPLRLFPIAAHVPVPARGAFAVWTGILEALRSTLDTTGADLVLLSAGMSSNLIVHALATSHPSVSALDCGSLWDPYVGRVTRRYHAAIVARERLVSA